MAAFDFDDDDIEAAAKVLKPICDAERTRSFRWYYDLGKQVIEQFHVVKAERERIGDTMYGEHFFDRLAAEIKTVSAQLLQQCLHLVYSYDEEAFAELGKHPAITPTHALYLGAILDGKLRKQLQAKVIEEELTVRELFKAIQGERGRQRQPGGGRRIKVPKNIKAAVIHFTAQAALFVKANEQVWFGEDFDIVDELAAVTADKLSDELKEQIQEVADYWEKIMALGKENSERLQEAIDRMDRRREFQAELERQAEAEDADEVERTCCTAG